MEPTSVIDTFRAAGDEALPTVKAALDPAAVLAAFEKSMPRFGGRRARLAIKSIQVVRHKPGKRCILEYHLKIRRPGQEPERVILIGKIRARRSGNEGFRILKAFWTAGFHDQSPDGISVPEPIGVLKDLRMWLQKKVKGQELTTLLRGDEPLDLAARVAEAIHKVHGSGVRAEHCHLIEDELRILYEKLPQVGVKLPGLSSRIEKLLSACARLGAALPQPEIRGIHRDFYPAQMLMHKGHLHLIDFDLFTNGDPALDVGNFLGHVTELSLREFGDPDALRRFENGLTEKLMELAGERCRRGVEGYALLTLVRHIYLSTQFPDRSSLTSILLELCEQRLAQAGFY